jgi:hypothetical protein
LNGDTGQLMRKIVYVQRPEAPDAPQRVWVREPGQPAPRPDEPADDLPDTPHPHVPLTDEAAVQAWIRYLFHAGVWGALREIRFA